MNPPRSGFDRLVACYEALERLAFGGALERARFHHLDALAGCRRVLILGDGDGRFLARLCRRLPEARIDSIDLSAAMLARARARLPGADAARVTFRYEDARTAVFEPGAYDAVVTLFFLDCFAEADARSLIGRLDSALAPGGRWLWSDFDLPTAGWRRARARVWLAILYFFFRWQTHLSARALPEVEPMIAATGCRRGGEATWQAGLLRSVVWTKPATR